MGRGRKLSFTMRYVLVFGILLLTANILMGVVVLNQSSVSMRELIAKDMLDMVNSAAGTLDGDVLNTLTADDVGGELYERIVSQLTVYLNTVDIHFIYVVRPAGEGKYIFIVDPDPEEPADFGEEIVVTGGLETAGTGVAAVDDAPMADRWGNFYSAYSPVMDSAGRVAAIVGIDFDATWYEAQVRRHTLSITIVTIVSCLVGGLLVFLITRRVSHQFRDLSDGLSSLSGNVDRLMSEIGVMPGYDSGAADTSEKSADELEALGDKIQEMQNGVRLYLDYLQEKAYIDALTKVRSATAYHELVQQLDARIADHTADFCVAVFDVNSLKEINDSHGHESGDDIIVGAAAVISGTFGVEQTYRIGGDEFAVVVEGMPEAEMAGKLKEVKESIRAFNASGRADGTALAISMGLTAYDPGSDADYKTVFARADRQMYAQKRDFYRTTGNRRRSED